MTDYCANLFCSETVYENEYCSSHSTLHIAVDFGGVLSILDNVETKLNMPNSLDILEKMNHKLSLVSFAGKKRANATKNEIETVCPDLFHRLFFVKNPCFKATVCKCINANILIDDTLEILESVVTTNPRLLGIWFTNENNHYQHSQIKIATSWQEIDLIVKKHQQDENWYFEHCTNYKSIDNKIYHI
jgi:hypothetical protein